MRLSVLLKARLGIGTRSIVKAMEVINEVFDDVLGELPCANTIDLWTGKCGLGTYEHNASELSCKEYCQIVDESMMIGSSRIVLTLAAPASHTGRPLRHSDVAVTGIAVAESFNAEGIHNAMSQAAEKAGHNPAYVITDNDVKMRKAVSLTGFRHHLDLSHSLALSMERIYKNDKDFSEYCKQMSECLFQNCMKRMAYLLPPKQRTVARFLNIGTWVAWSRAVLNAWPRLTRQEREMLSFVPRHASLVDELHDVVSCVHSIEEICKGKGISKRTAKECINLVHKELSQGNVRMRKLADDIVKYIEGEVLWMDERESHNCSSDIIESSFGILKARKSPNKLYGATALVLHLPIFEKLSDRETASDYDMKKHFEQIRVVDINKWKRDYLPQNLVSKRIKVLAKAEGF